MKGQKYCCYQYWEIRKISGREGEKNLEDKGKEAGSKLEAERRKENTEYI